MAGNKYLERTSSGDHHQRASVNSTAGVADANKIVSLNAFGYLDPSMIQGESVESFVAFEAIAAGDLVNVFDDGGTAKVRKATNTGEATRAHGFAPSSILITATGDIYMWSATIAGLSGLTVGGRYVLGTAGGVLIASSSPTADSTIVQQVGVAKTTTVFEFNADMTVIINDSAT